MIAVPAAQATPPPTSSVPRSPIAGIRANPASSEPRIAPVVLTAYSRAAAAAAAGPLGTPSARPNGKTAPRATVAGSNSAAASAASVTINGTNPPSENATHRPIRSGSSSTANNAAAVLIPTTARHQASRAAADPPTHSRTPSDAPIAMPPMNATSIVLNA